MSFSYEMVEGEIEALGQSRFDHSGHFYSYIRLLKSDGNVEMINNIGVHNTVGSYLKIGEKGKFYYVKIGPWKGLYALRMQDRVAEDIEMMRDTANKVARKGPLWCMILGVFPGILFWGLGLILAAFGAYKFFKGVPTVEGMRAQIA